MVSLSLGLLAVKCPWDVLLALSGRKEAQGEPSCLDPQIWALSVYRGAWSHRSEWDSGRVGGERE